MNDPAAAPGDPIPAAAPETPSPAVPPVRKPGVLRRSAFIILAVVILLFAVILPFWADSWVRSTILTALDDRGLELAPDSELSVSVFGLRLNAAKLQIREKGKPQDAPVFRAEALTAKLALIDSITSGDVIIDELRLDGVRGDLRRRADGKPPVGVPEDGTTTPGQSQDWLAMAKRGLDWWRSRKAEEEKQAQPRPGEPPPAPKPLKTNDRWAGKAVRYEPPPVIDPASGRWRIPRLLVRTLSIQGTTVGLPDETPFDVARFTVRGTTIAARLNPDEVMTLTGEILTGGAGPMDLKLERTGGTGGKLELKAPMLPVEAIANPKVSGDSLVHYGAKGLANLTFATTWTGWDMQGAVTSTVQDLSMQPDKEAGERAFKVAQVVNNLKGQTLIWPVKLGGTLYAPTITDSGVDEVLKGSALEAAKNAAKEKANQEADKLKDKAIKEVDGKLGDKLKDQPAAQDAADKAKSLFKGFGK